MDVCPCCPLTSYNNLYLSQNFFSTEEKKSSCQLSRVMYACSLGLWSMEAEGLGVHHTVRSRLAWATRGPENKNKIFFFWL